MSINPNIPEVPRIINPNTYPEEIFSAPLMEGIPSFFEFLVKHRGIPAHTFSKESLEHAALNTELVFYNAFVSRIQQNMAKSEHTAEAEAEQEKKLKEASVEELQMMSGYLSEQLKRVDEEIQKATQELVNTP